MKIFASTTVALTLLATSIAPGLTGVAMAQTSDMMLRDMIMRGQITGEIESINGSTVMVRTVNGSRMYQIDPMTITALKLTNGSTILVNSRNLMTGVITDINRYDLDVKLDNGETENLLVTEEDRGILATGDRVYITPNQRVVRADDYFLTARDVSLVQMIAVGPETTTETVRSSRTEVETQVQRVAPVPAAVAPVPVPVPTVERIQPVRALW